MAGVEEVLGTPLSPRCCSEDGWVRGAESRSSASGSAHGKPLPRKCEGCRDRPQPVHAIPSLWSPRASPPLPHTVPVTSWGRRCCPDAGRCPEAAPRLRLGLCCSLSEGKGRSQPRRRTGGDIRGAQGQGHDNHSEGTSWERFIYPGEPCGGVLDCCKSQLLLLPATTTPEQAQDPRTGKMPTLTLCWRPGCCRRRLPQHLVLVLQPGRGRQTGQLSREPPLCTQLQPRPQPSPPSPPPGDTAGMDGQGGDPKKEKYVLLHG